MKTKKNKRGGFGMFGITSKKEKERIKQEKIEEERREANRRKEEYKKKIEEEKKTREMQKEKKIKDAIEKLKKERNINSLNTLKKDNGEVISLKDKPFYIKEAVGTSLNGPPTKGVTLHYLSDYEFFMYRLAEESQLSNDVIKTIKSTDTQYTEVTYSHYNIITTEQYTYYLKSNGEEYLLLPQGLNETNGRKTIMNTVNLPVNLPE